MKRQPNSKLYLPSFRFTIALIPAAIIAIFFGGSIIEKMAFASITFSVVNLLLDWLLITKSTGSFIQKMAEKEDGSRPLFFTMIALAALLGFITVALMLIGEGNDHNPDASTKILAIANMLASWFLLHTLFTFHYARVYYRSKKSFDFPSKEETELPNYFDFAYFSFGIGCTFQTADVEVVSSSLRKTVLLHSVVSFFINTFIIALTINTLK